MGRGRAKAKQTKVARDLKYRTHETDLSALARELHGGPGDPLGRVAPPDDTVEDDAEVDSGVDSGVDGADSWSDRTDDRG